MADITVQVGTPDGVALSMGAAAANDTIPVSSGDHTVLVVANASGGSINVTVTAQTTSSNVDGYGSVTLADKVVAVADGATSIIGPFGDAFISTAGQVELAYSSTTSVTRTALKLNKPA